MEVIKIVNVFNGRVQQFLTASSECQLISRNMDASKKTCVAKGILVFDFELFIGGRCGLLRNVGTLFAKSNKHGIYTNVDSVLRHRTYFQR